MMKAKESLQPKVERSTILNTITSAAPYSVPKTNYALLLFSWNMSSSFTKEITSDTI